MDENNPIIKTYIPYVVNYVTDRTPIPQNKEELIQFCQELVKQIIPKILEVKKN